MRLLPLNRLSMQQAKTTIKRRQLNAGFRWRRLSPSTMGSATMRSPSSLCRHASRNRRNRGRWVQICLLRMRWTMSRRPDVTTLRRTNSRTHWCMAHKCNVAVTHRCIDYSARIHICKDTQMNRCIYAYIHISTYAQVHRLQCKDARIHILTDTHMHRFTYPHMHRCIDAHIHICTDAHTHRRTDAHLNKAHFHRCTYAQRHMFTMHRWTD